MHKQDPSPQQVPIYGVDDQAIFVSYPRAASSCLLWPIAGGTVRTWRGLSPCPIAWPLILISLSIQPSRRPAIRLLQIKCMSNNLHLACVHSKRKPANCKSHRQVCQYLLRSDSRTGRTVARCLGTLQCAAGRQGAFWSRRERGRARETERS